jgi:putative ABC transport system substrate-binding protein
VFISGDDPIKFGLVTSLNRPGGNVTGVSLSLGVLGAKRLELLRELVPAINRIAFLVNSDSPNTEVETADVQDAARALGLRVQVLSVRRESEFAPVFATMAQSRPIALVTASDPFFVTQRRRIAELALQHRIPAIYTTRIWADAGGLSSYGTDLNAAHRQAGAYASQILKGANPGDLPVVQSDKFEFVINLKTAKALGIEVSHKLLALADSVIE